MKDKYGERRGRKSGFDDFGNPDGDAYDLGAGDAERLRGEKILLYVGYGVPGLHPEEFEWHHAQEAVKRRHLQMDILYAKSDHKCALKANALRGYSQLWYVSNQCETLSRAQTRQICKFVREGNGLLIWADNAPYFADANILARKLIGTRFSGDRMGDGVLRPGPKLARGRFIEHPLTQGINSLYEGITICTVKPVEGLTVLAQSHDGQYCMACYEKGMQRIVLDTGFTKLCDDRFDRTAGTARYFRNIAFWLARATRDSQYTLFTPGRENLATVDPGGISEQYRTNVKEPAILKYILHWEGRAELGLAITDRQGQTVFDASSRESPLRAEVAAGAPGDWSCRVKGVNVSTRDFPYVLTLVVRKGQAIAPSLTDAGLPSLAPQVSSKLWPCYVLVDCSQRASDVGSLIGQGVSAFLQGLRGIASASLQPGVAVVACRQDNTEPCPVRPIDQLRPINLACQGEPVLATAMRNVADAVEEHIARGEPKPLVIVVLAAHPSDEFQGEAARLRELARRSEVNIVAVGMGAAVPDTLLTSLANIPLRVVELQDTVIAACFAWLAKVAGSMVTSLDTERHGRAIDVPALPNGVKQVV